MRCTWPADVTAYLLVTEAEHDFNGVQQYLQTR